MGSKGTSQKGWIVAVIEQRDETGGGGGGGVDPRTVETIGNRMLV